MKVLRYITLIIILLNIPGFFLLVFGAGMGSLFSYVSFVLLLAYYGLEKKNNPPWIFLVFAILFFVLSGINYSPDSFFYFDFIKYLVLIVCGSELARHTSLTELFIVLFIGALSIFINAVFFPNNFGRYSGLFFNPNAAGFICIMACALTYSFKNETVRLTLLLIVTLCGVLTFSRTFFLLWVLMNIISIFQNPKNGKALFLGLAMLFVFVGLSSALKLNTERLELLTGLLDNKLDTETASDDNRTETWEMYYDDILDAPLIGKGYKYFSGQTNEIKYTIGVHNTYLRIIGEAGIIPFLLFIGIYAYIFFKSLTFFKSKIYLMLLTICISGLLLTLHNFIEQTYVMLITLWVYNNLKKDEETEPNLLTPANI